MKIELDLPDWCDERGIHILVGIEEVARRMPPDFNWLIKTERCNMCGACCKNQPEDWFLGRKKNGDCKYLTDKNDCALGANRPYLCCVSEGEPEECSIRWKTLK